MMSNIFKNKYQADKVRKTDPYFNGSEKVIKVEGGYVLMDTEEYRIWKMQK